MRADPKPDDLAILFNSCGAIVLGNSDGIYRSFRMNPLEMQAGMIRIFLKPSICCFRLFLNIIGNSASSFLKDSVV